MNKLYYFSPLILQDLIWVPMRIFLKFFYHFEVRGWENLKDLDKKNGVIFAVNHSSEMDPILIPASLPFLSHLMPMFYVSRTADFYDTSGLLGKILYGGIFFKIWGAHPAYKTEKKGDYEFSLQNHIDLLKHEKSICIFPEGKKTMDGEIQEGKLGVAFLTLRTNAVVIPTRIDGVFKITSQKFWSRKIYATVNFGKPLRSDDLFEKENAIDVEEYKKATQKIMGGIKTA